MKTLSYFNGVMVALFIFIGCAAQQETKRPAVEKGAIKNFELMKEDFDPLTVMEDDIKIEEPNVTHNNLEDVTENLESPPKDTLVTGYRIQIIQTTEAEEAKNVQKDAILKFDADVYRVFDPPFYKVRVGDFINWYDAEKLQKLAIQKGYPDAWVIRTKVNLKKASKWLDNFE